MVFFKQNFIFIICMIFIMVLWIYVTKKEKEKDAVADYSKLDLGGVFLPLKNQGTGLFFKYDKITQKRKKDYILQNIFQNMEVENEHGYQYKISELLDDAYYEVEYSSDGTVRSKRGPYVVYKVIPNTELKYSSINIDRTNGSVQVAMNNSVAHQRIEGDTFLNKVNEYRELMITHGISKEDIKVVTKYPNDDDIKQSFFSKYGIELAKITLDIGGKFISLLSFLKN